MRDVPLSRTFVMLMIASLLGLLALPTPAAAHHASVGEYIDRGFAVWEGELEHCEYVDAEWRPLGREIYGVARVGGCAFSLNEQLVGELHSEPGLLCTTVIHEMGHLAGHDDDFNDRSSVMYYANERGWVAEGC